MRRNQFTEITGPGGIHGSANPESDPVWALGWDARSVLLALLEDGAWSHYRLPKGGGQVSRFKIGCRRLGMIGSKHYGKAVANRY